MIERISDIGNIRKQNEDSYGILEDVNYNVFLICDGMGGHNAGEVASQLAMEAVVETIKKCFEDNLPDMVLTKAFYTANEWVYKKSLENPEMKGMGTTATCALSYEKSLYVAHVGDSSLFQIRDEKIKKVTKDHSYVQQLLDLGRINESEAKDHPKKNIITRAVGTSRIVQVDQLKLDTQSKDIYLLCTDGLTDYLNDDEILAEILSHTNQKETLESLARMAKDRGGKDNITLLLFGGEALK